jgi:hypothetical protein
MKHPLEIKKYSGSLEDLAMDIGNLRYDALSSFLDALHKKMATDAIKDQEKRRIKLAAHLESCAQSLKEACKHADLAWSICKPYME